MHACMYVCTYVCMYLLPPPGLSFKGVFPIIFHPPGLSNVYIFVNCSVIPTDPLGTFTLGVSNLFALKLSFISPKGLGRGAEGRGLEGRGGLEERKGDDGDVLHD